ncbi:hypothetical protein DsansV1_C01g0007321 [Dioscorea sansibarensis]
MKVRRFQLVRRSSHQDRHLKLVDQASQRQEGDNEAPISNKVDLLYQAMGRERKYQVYGAGSHASIFYS